MVAKSYPSISLKKSYKLPIRMTNTMDQLAEIYVKEIVRLNCVPISISNRDERFTSTFWEKLHKAMGTRLKFSTTFHPQTDDVQSERTIQTVEDMLRGCAIDFQGSWSKYIPLVEFFLQ